MFPPTEPLCPTPAGRRAGRAHICRFTSCCGQRHSGTSCRQALYPKSLHPDGIRMQGCQPTASTGPQLQQNALDAVTELSKLPKRLPPRIPLLTGAHAQLLCFIQAITHSTSTILSPRRSHMKTFPMKPQRTCCALYSRARNQTSRAFFWPTRRASCVDPYPASKLPTLGPVCPNTALSAAICQPNGVSYASLWSQTLLHVGHFVARTTHFAVKWASYALPAACSVQQARTVMSHIMARMLPPPTA